MQFTSTLRALNTIRPVRAPVSVAPLPCAVRRSAPCVCVCNLRAAAVPCRVPPPPGAPTAPRWALRLPPPCALVTACGWRGLYAPAAPPNVPFGAIAARLFALRAAKLLFGAVRCWGRAPSRRGYRRSFYPRCGVLRTCAPTPGALCGGNPPAPPIRIKRIVGTARDAYASCPAIQPNRRENNHTRACQSGGDPPSPPLFAHLIRQTNTNNNINDSQ